MGCTSSYGIQVGVSVLEQVRSLCGLAKVQNFGPQNRVLNNGVLTVGSTKPSLVFCPKQGAETEGVVPRRVSIYLSFFPLVQTRSLDQRSSYLLKNKASGLLFVSSHGLRL